MAAFIASVGFWYLFLARCDGSSCQFGLRQSKQNSTPAANGGMMKVLVVLVGTYASFPTSPTTPIAPVDSRERRIRPKRTGSALVSLANASQVRGSSLLTSMLKRLRSIAILMEAVSRYYPMGHFQYEVQVITPPPPPPPREPGIYSSPESKSSPQYPQALLAPYEASTQQVEAASSELDLAHSLKMRSHPESGFGQGGMRDWAPLLHPSLRS